MRKEYVIGGLLFFSAQSVFALNLQGYKFSDSYRYSLLDDSLKEKFSGRYVVTASYGYIHSPFYYSDTYLHDKRKDIINSNNIFTAGFSYYLNNNVSLGFDLNAIHNTTFGDTRTTLADSVLKARINLKRTKSFSLSLNPQLILPTGKTSNFSSMNSVGGSLSVVAEKSLGRFHLLASLGGMSAKNNSYLDVDHRQLLLTQLGVSYDVSDTWNVNLESYRNFPLVNDTYQDDGKYFITAKNKTHRIFSTYFGAGVTALGNVQRDSYSAFVGVKFHEPAPPVVDTVAVASAAPKRIPKSEVYFGHDKDNINDSELSSLQDYINYLNKSPEGKIILEGHASAPGPSSYNMKLSERRARHVKEYLVKNGVSENILKVEPHGEEDLIYSDDAQNRRVHFRVEQ